MSARYVLQPLLAYVFFSMQSATVDNVRKAALSYFTPAQILDAKDALWGNIDCEIIGEKPRRKSSNARPEAEAMEK